MSCYYYRVYATWMGFPTSPTPLRRRKSCCSCGPRRLASGRTTVGQVYSNPSEETPGVAERSKVPSSSPMDAFMFNLAEMLGIVVGADLYQWFLVS
ncbi:hypothetical protein PSENEW3n2_00000690 [Picochlorum sp. SENEW3]|nr:hypothetical protein PSENEW3n2_00000690 [Picochlorum sp. SENEW3]WPT15611.1 hypothetical protein PSENEW3_00000690 [Picochlorum sp. SENEW3]